MIEVELKFPVASIQAVQQQFLELGAVHQSESTQSDEYFNDPLRDFAKLDCALRIRRCEKNCVLTYKGPNLDETAKIRQEIEIPFADAGAAEGTKQIFESIGFVSVANVIKRREELVLCWRDQNVHVCVDKVDEVGGFVELELVVATDNEVAEAKATLLALAEVAGLSGPIRTSYLTMLLKNRGQI